MLAAFSVVFCGKGSLVYSAFTVWRFILVAVSIVGTLFSLFLMFMVNTMFMEAAQRFSHPKEHDMAENVLLLCFGLFIMTNAVIYCGIWLESALYGMKRVSLEEGKFRRLMNKVFGFLPPDMAKSFLMPMNVPLLLESLAKAKEENRPWDSEPPKFHFIDDEKDKP